MKSFEQKTFSVPMFEDVMLPTEIKNPRGEKAKWKSVWFVYFCCRRRLHMISPG